MTPSTVILRRTPSHCHSEERTPKNLRHLLTRWLVVVMDRPSEEHLRFLTPFGMTLRGIGVTPSTVILRSALRRI